MIICQLKFQCNCTCHVTVTLSSSFQHYCHQLLQQIFLTRSYLFLPVHQTTPSALILYLYPPHNCYLERSLLSQRPITLRVTTARHQQFLSQGVLPPELRSRGAPEQRGTHSGAGNPNVLIPIHRVIEDVLVVNGRSRRLLGHQNLVVHRRRLGDRDWGDGNCGMRGWWCRVSWRMCCCVGGGLVFVPGGR